MNQPRNYQPRNNQSRIAMIGLLAGLVAVTALNSSVRAQAAAPAAPTHIAVIDFLKVYRDMAETKATNETIKGLQDKLELQVKSDKRVLDDLQTSLTQVTADSQKHEDIMNDIDQKSLQFASAEKAIDVQATRLHARQITKAYAEINAAVASIAKARGLDLVLVTNANDLPPNAGDATNQEQLANAIFNRSFLYVSPRIDITADVVAAVDAAAKAAPPAAGH